MKSILFVILCVLGQALDLRILDEPDPHQVLQKALSNASLEVIWAEIKHRIEECGKSDGPLADVPIRGLQKELARRAAKKDCTPKPEEPPPKASEPTPTTKQTTTTTTTTTTTSCPDNFMDELVDQANVDFGMLDQNKDDCISREEMTSSLDNMLKVNEEKVQYYWNNVSEQGKNLTAMAEQQIKSKDKNGDGCLSKDEFDHIRFSMCDCPAQFKLMDHSGDGKVSKTEASRYVNNHMEHADLSLEKFNAIFAAADADQDGFINESEFCKAGPRYKGDGNHEKFF